jgi:hypothetical protein
MLRVKPEVSPASPAPASDSEEEAFSPGGAAAEDDALEAAAEAGDAGADAAGGAVAARTKSSPKKARAEEAQDMEEEIEQVRAPASEAFVSIRGSFLSRASSNANP